MVINASRTIGVFFDHHDWDNRSVLVSEMAALYGEGCERRANQAAGAIAERRPSVSPLREMEVPKSANDVAGRFGAEVDVGHQVAFIQGKGACREQDVESMVAADCGIGAFRSHCDSSSDPRNYQDVSKCTHVVLEKSKGGGSPGRLKPPSFMGHNLTLLPWRALAIARKILSSNNEKL